MTSSPPELFPVTQASVEHAHAFVFAPWIRDLGLCDFKVDRGRASARLPIRDELKFFSGAVCGQALMAAIDTVAAIAMATTEREPKSTLYQHTHFLRPALDEDFMIHVEVMRFGKTTAYAEAKVTSASAGEPIAHATLAFAF